MARDIDISLARVQMITDELHYYISSLVFTPTGWIDPKPFSEGHHIAIHSNGYLRVYDEENDRYFSIYELEDYQISSLAFRLVELLNDGTITLNKNEFKNK
jgi:hypothetical protein